MSGFLQLRVGDLGAVDGLRRPAQRPLLAGGRRGRRAFELRRELSYLGRRFWGRPAQLPYPKAGKALIELAGDHGSQGQHVSEDERRAQQGAVVDNIET